jgi:hypothetical protein
MFKGIANFAMQGRWSAALATAALSLLAIIVPPLSYLASGVIVLTTLRMGPKEGLLVVVASLAVFTGFAVLLLGNFVISVGLLLSGLLPIYLVTLVLGFTRSLSLSVLASAGLGLLVVLVMHLVVSEPALWWQQMLQPFVEMLQQQPGWQASQQQTAAVLASIASLMTGFIGAGITLNALFGLFIGRSWQSKLYNPGGFADEFVNLQLGKPAALLTVALIAISLLPIKSSLPVLVDCLPVMLVIFVIQGLAIVHRRLRQRQKTKLVVVAYVVLAVLMFIMPPLAIVLAMIGVLEQWRNFRNDSTE